MYLPLSTSSCGTVTIAVTKTSTVWPAFRRPPTARSSETVSETARQASESGLTDSSGPRIENWPPSEDEASMFVVTSWPCRIVTAGIRPMTSWTSVATPAALVSSSGTSRTVTSSATIAWRAGIARTATTTAAFCVPGLGRPAAGPG